MKIRSGFVSNSSSSSFIIKKSRISRDVLETLIGLSIEQEKLLGHLDEYDSQDSILSIREDVSGKSFFEEIHDSGYGYRPSKINNLIEEYNEPVFIIDSTGDNTIPRSLQDILQDLGFRQHWG